MKFLYSLDAVYRAPWELFGILFFLGLGYAAWKKRREIDWFYVAIPLGLVFAVAWRASMGVNSDRYHSIFIFPALFFSFYLIWHGPWPRKISYCLLGVVVAICVVKDLRYNPHDAEVYSLYGKVRSDSKNFKSPYGLSFTNGSGREKYYAGLPIDGNDRCTSIGQVLSGLKENLSVFDGDYDVIYVFLKSSAEEGDLTERILQLAPTGQISIIGKSYVDRKQKKCMIIFRYLSGKNRNEGDVEHAKLLPNGDFKELQAPEPQKRAIDRLRRLSPRFESEHAQLPAKWTIYQSLTFTTTNLVSVREKKDGNVLYMEANNSYEVAITPVFSAEKEKYFSFHIHALSESFLQISREVIFSSGKRDLFPILPIRIPAGTDRRYEIRLPSGPEYKDGAIWFWFHRGKMELSDVRIR